LAFDRTLVQIRERTYLDILDLALVVLRRRPLTLGLAAVAGCAPWMALNAWIVEQFPDFPGVLYLFLLALEAPWATAPLTVVLGGLMFGDRPAIPRILRVLTGSLLPMLFFQGFLRGLLLTITMLAWLIPTRMAFLNQVVFLERGRWRAMFTRAGDLCGDRGGEFFLRAIAEFLFGLLFVFCFWWAASAATDLLFSGWSWEEMETPGLHDWRTQLGIWIAISFFAVARFLAYIDQRIRLEGWEVELRLRQVGAALEDGERW
jgi:hypothetical protein